MRILVVDDEPGNRFMARILLEDEGFEVDEAEDGYAALAACAAGRYDLVVLDQRMPGLTGVEVAIKLRAEGWATPLVLYSAYVADAIEIVAQAEGLGLRLVDKVDVDGLVDAAREVAATVS